MGKLFGLVQGKHIQKMNYLALQKIFVHIDKCNLNMNLSELCAQRGSRSSHSMTASSWQDNIADTPRAQTMRHVNKTVASTGQCQYSTAQGGSGDGREERSQQNLHNHNQNGINNKSNANTSKSDNRRVAKCNQKCHNEMQKQRQKQLSSGN